MHKIIITRPMAQAQPLAARIASLGMEEVLFPLLEIHPLADPTALRKAASELQDYAMAAFVSPNAIDAMFAELPRWPSNVAIGIMGEGSRAALARHGLDSGNATIFSPLDPLKTDSETLLQALDLAALRGKRVLIVRGENGRELLAEGLRSAGIDVTQVAAYRRAAPELDDRRRQQLRELLDGANDWIITSSEALRILMAMVEQTSGSDGVAKLQHQHVVVPHVRIAETAHALGFPNVTLTGSGDEQLLAALQSRA
jgi:uroporphyrinogen-III synthase